jgi:AraC-like DNA-binding protein/two-component sensor histidine kinase
MKVWRRKKNKKTAGAPSAAEVDAARIRFFANIVNELRAPLGVIIGQVEAASFESDADARRHQLRVAMRNARRLERLSGQALDLTRLESGSVEKNLQTVEVLPFVESLVMSFEELADRNGIHLEFLARRKSIRGTIDPVALTTILSNLMSNAVKHTLGGGRIGVALDFRAPDIMHLTISDSGSGIAPAQQALIFEPFLLPAEENGVSGGSAGIGLPLAYGLARLLGGEINVQSEPGRGARFDVRIPIGVDVEDDVISFSDTVRPEVTEEILYRSTVYAPALPSEEKRAKTIIIDGNAEFGSWMAESLADIVDVKLLPSLDTAIEDIKEAMPELVIADDRVDVFDSVALTRALRADENTSHIPVVLISASASSDRRSMAFDAGADDYLGKPVAARELRSKVSSILDRYAELRARFREQIIVRPADVSARSVDQHFIEKVTSAIESAIDDNDFSVQELGDAVAMSTSQLTRKLKALIDQTPAQLIRRTRLQRAAALIAVNAGQLSEICFQVGFSDQSHFSRSFKKHFGVSPKQYRTQYAEEARND